MLHVNEELVATEKHLSPERHHKCGYTSSHAFFGACVSKIVTFFLDILQEQLKETYPLLTLVCLYPGCSSMWAFLRTYVCMFVCRCKLLLDNLLDRVFFFVWFLFCHTTFFYSFCLSIILFNKIFTCLFSVGVFNCRITKLKIILKKIVHNPYCSLILIIVLKCFQTCP